MLDYIMYDFEKARITHDDPTIGGMVICDSADQAKKMHEIFQEKYTNSAAPDIPTAAEPELLTIEKSKHINNLLVKEYLDEYQGKAA